MKLIFLDIDGVLNCRTTPNPRDFPYIVDETLLARLRQLLERTGASVVLSSTWRYDPAGIYSAKHYGVPFIDGWSQPVDATLYLKGEMEFALMGRRFHRGFTAAEKAELWDRWKRGESLKAIGRAFGKPSSSIYFLVAP